MKFRVALALLIGNLAVLAGVGFWCFDTSGHLREDFRWVAPAPRFPDLSLNVTLAKPQEGDVNQFLQSIERPLFSPIRRQPPPPKPDPIPEAPKPPDPLDSLQLFGVIEGGGNDAILASVQGQTQTLKANSTIGDWTIQSIKGREITVKKTTGETRTLFLEHAKALTAPPPEASPSVSSAPEPTPATTPTPARSKRKGGFAFGGS